MVYGEIRRFTWSRMYYDRLSPCRIRRNTTIYMVPYVLRPFISVSYTEKYGDIRRKKRSFTVSVHGGHIRSQYTEAIYGLSTRRPYTVSVLLRFSPYIIVLLRIRARRYTIVIRDHVIRQNTVVYGGIRIVHGRLRAYTDSVIIDLGSHFCERPVLTMRSHDWSSTNISSRHQNRSTIYSTKANRISSIVWISFSAIHSTTNSVALHILSASCFTGRLVSPLFLLNDHTASHTMKHFSHSKQK
jgi:hypothetical protein